MKSKALKALLGVAALVTGVVAVPVAALVNWGLGLFMLALPVFFVYKSHD